MHSFKFFYFSSLLNSLNLVWTQQPAQYIHITMFDLENACLLNADE